MSGKLAAGALSVLLLGMLSRILSPAGLGAFFLILTSVNLCATIGGLGLHQAIVRYLGEANGRRESNTAKAILYRTLLIGGFGALVVTGCITLFGQQLFLYLFDLELAESVVTLVGIWIFVATLHRLVGEGFRGVGKFFYVTLYSALSVHSGVVTVGMATATTSMLLFRESVSLELLLVVMITVSAVTMSLAAIELYRLVDSSDSRASSRTPSIGALFQTGWPVLIANLCAFLATHADILVLGAFLNEADLAVYAVASRLAILLVMPLSILNGVVPPLITEFHIRRQLPSIQDILQAGATIATLIGVTVVVIFVFAGKTVLDVVFGPFYQAAYPILLVLAVGQLINVSAGSCGISLMLTGHERANMRVAILGGTVLIGLGWMATEAWGAMGMAGVIVLTVALQNILLVLLAHRRLGIWTSARISPDTLRIVRRLVAN